MVAPKSASSNSVVVAVAACVSVAFAIACATSPKDETQASRSEAQLIDLRVESDSAESTVVTLVGLDAPIYTAVYNEDLRAVVVDLEAVTNQASTSLVEVYDGLVDYVTVSSYAEGDGEPVTRVEIALAVEADFEATNGADGLSFSLSNSRKARAWRKPRRIRGRVRATSSRPIRAWRPAASH
jgi:hypothetical protein